MISEIMFPDLNAAAKLRLMLGVDIFRNRFGVCCRIVDMRPAYPHVSKLKQIWVKVEGREKDIHAVRAIAWAAYHFFETPANDPCNSREQELSLYSAHNLAMLDAQPDGREDRFDSLAKRAYGRSFLEV